MSTLYNEIAKFIEREPSSLNLFLTIAIETDNIEYLKFLIKLERPNSSSILELFSIACLKGYLDIIIELFEHWKDTILSNSVTYRKTFVDVCKAGYIDVATQLYNWFPSMANPPTYYWDLHLMIECILTGNLEMVLQVYKWWPNINLKYNNWEVMRTACISGHLNIMIQIYEWSNYTIDLRMWDDWLYKHAKKHGYTDIINQIHIWLPNVYFKMVSKNNTDILECPICHTTPNEIVKTPCSHNFCYECLDQWCKINMSCPYCRSLLL
jgi:hypothetical protein